MPHPECIQHTHNRSSVHLHNCLARFARRLKRESGIVRNMKIMLAVCILQLFVFANCVSLEDFFSFGEAVGDVKLPNKKHVFGKVFNLYSTYSFYNKGFNDLRVSEFSRFYLRWPLFSALYRVVYGLSHLSFYLMLWNFFARYSSNTPVMHLVCLECLFSCRSFIQFGKPNLKPIVS